MSYFGKVTNKITGMPMAGVPVSDGRNVVLTDSSGCYSLPGWERSNTVSVYVLTQCHDDWYAYTGGKSGVYDFSLCPVSSEKFEMLHTTDTEITNDTDLEWLDFVRQKVASEKPALLMHTGDICGREGMLRHRQVMNYDTMGCPVRYVIGNHDFVPGDADYGEQVYEQLYGPAWYAFDCAGIHCLVLSLGHGGRGDMASGYEKEDQWIWLKNALEAVGQCKPLVVFCHDQGPDAYEFILGDVDLKQHGLLAWIYGHTHSNYHHIRSGVHNICTARPDSGGIDSSVAGIRKITVEDRQVVSQMFYREFPTDTPDKPVWQRKLPGNITFCEPVKFNNDLLVGTMQDALPGQGGIYCVNLESGDVRWSFDTRGGINSNISLEDDKVYAQDCMGWLYCLDAKTGDLLWQKETYLGGAGKTKLSAFVAGDLVLCGKPREIIARDKHTGLQVWRTPALKRGGDTPSRPVYDREKKRLYIGGQWGYLACLDAKTGEDVWRRKEKPLWYRTQTPCLDSDVLYTGGFDTLLKLDANTGETLLEANVGEPARRLGAPAVESDGQLNVCGGPVIDGDTLYCPTASAGVLALDKNTLAVLRRFPAGKAGILTSPYTQKGAQTVESRPVIADDLLIFTALDAKVYFYNKNTAELLKTISLPAPSLVKPIIDGKYIYTVDFGGNVCKYLR